MRRAAWLPPVVWMAIILGMSSDTGSAEHTGRVIRPLLQLVFPGATPLQIDAMHGIVRKLGHLIEYAILAGLWFRALARDGSLSGRRAAWGAWLIATAWAAVDESYQSTVGSRTGSPMDVAIDGLGALAVAVPAGYGWRATADRVAEALLWTAAVGGAALLVLNLALGVGAGLLWLTVPAAVIALAVVRRRRRPTP